MLPTQPNWAKQHQKFDVEFAGSMRDQAHCIVRPTQFDAPSPPRFVESSTPMTNAISLTKINKRFGTKLAVIDLDLAIPQGALIGLIGPNGAGKTTSIRMIMSIIFPDSGGIEVLGKQSAVESKDRIGYLPEERGLYKKMKVGDFLTYVGRLKGLDGAGLERKVRDWLERVALPDCYRKKCEELSKGMQQKAQFIASVLHEPDLLILDEPFSGLDPVNARLLRGLVDEQHKRGCTLIFSTHQMSQAEALCDRVVMIHQGRKVLDNTLGEIHARYTPREVRFEPAGDLDESRISAIAGVARLERSNGTVWAHLDADTPSERVLQQIAASTPVRKIEVVRPTLEDVFIGIVAGSAKTPEERAELLALMRASGVKPSTDASGD
jgi:ABC-2 type transport system ATP-binding protein